MPDCAIYLKDVKSIIEVDGRVHAGQKRYDRIRNQAFKDAGYGVFRIRDTFLAAQPDRVIEELRGFIENRKATLKYAKLKKKEKAKKAAKNWRNVPKLNKNHLPKKK